MEYGNNDINKILEIIAQFNNGICDGTQKEQRQYGKHLLNKVKKIDKVQNGKYSWEDYISGLLGVVSENVYHNHKISGPKTIYYNLAGLIQIANSTVVSKKKTQDLGNGAYSIGSVAILPGI